MIESVVGNLFSRATAVALFLVDLPTLYIYYNTCTCTGVKKRRSGAAERMATAHTAITWVRGHKTDRGYHINRRRSLFLKEQEKRMYRHDVCARSRETVVDIYGAVTMVAPHLPHGIRARVRKLPPRVACQDSGIRESMGVLWHKIDTCDGSPPADHDNVGGAIPCVVGNRQVPQRRVDAQGISLSMMCCHQRESS